MNYNVGVIHISDNVGFLFEELFILSEYILFSGHLSKFKTVIERNGILPHLFCYCNFLCHNIQPLFLLCIFSDSTKKFKPKWAI